ncbi:BnaC02g22590D [Brassica napus]|uniref:strictosidine synthase n=1 Tax=Brassica napus TaxID=3708 RepID=A0A078I7K4_BRANA|nr:BnaC02g22590D [Brassica napus]
MMSFFSIISLLLLLFSLSSVVISDGESFQKLPVPENRSGPEAFAFDSTGKGFYTGVSGGKILKYTPETGYVDFAQITESSNSSWCDGVVGTALAGRCGRPAGIAFNEKTGELYVADAPLGLHVVSPAGGLAVKIADSVDGKPFKFLDGLDVDPTTGVVYFTSFSSRYTPIQVLIALGLKDATGKLFKYDPSTKVVTVLMEGLSGSAGCAVSSDGSFVLVSQFTKSNIKRYWIKGPKAAGSTDDIFSSSVSNPDNIRRIGSTGNFWVASVINKVVMPTDPSAVKIDSNGKVLQTIFLKNEFGNTLLSEANEVDGKLYIGTLTGPFAGVMKL